MTCSCCLVLTIIYILCQLQTVGDSWCAVWLHVHVVLLIFLSARPVGHSLRCSLTSRCGAPLGRRYAKLSQDTRASFERFTAEYFAQRASLAMVFLLIDSSVPPQKVDLDYACKLAEAGVAFCIVFTKADKRKKGGAAGSANMKAFKRSLLVQVRRRRCCMLSCCANYCLHCQARLKSKLEQDHLCCAFVRRARPGVYGLGCMRSTKLRVAHLLCVQGFSALPPSVVTSADTGLGKGQLLGLIASLREAFEKSGRLKEAAARQPAPAAAAPEAEP